MDNKPLVDLLPDTIVSNLDHYANLYHSEKNDILLRYVKTCVIIKIFNDALKSCPHCKAGKYIMESSDEEYSTESWLVCEECDSVAPQGVFNSVIELDNLYQEYPIYENLITDWKTVLDKTRNGEEVCIYELESIFSEDFDVDAYQKYNKSSWQAYIDSELSKYTEENIKQITKVLSNAEKNRVKKKLDKAIKILSKGSNEIMVTINNVSVRKEKFFMTDGDTHIKCCVYFKNQKVGTYDFDNTTKDNKLFVDEGKDGIARKMYDEIKKYDNVYINELKRTADKDLIVEKIGFLPYEMPRTNNDRMFDMCMLLSELKSLSKKAKVFDSDYIAYMYEKDNGICVRTEHGKLTMSKEELLNSFRIDYLSPFIAIKNDKGDFEFIVE